MKRVTGKMSVGSIGLWLLWCVVATVVGSAALRADEPYARSRNYDLQHSRIALRFDLENKKVIGEVTHTLALLREGLDQVSFDSVGLEIHSVKINKSAAKFEITPKNLIVHLPRAGKLGEKYDVEIQYEGRPTKGLYFILPDKDYPNRPKQIWTQGESEDTRYYLPTYDYPNDRLTTETVLTVPSDWLTISNGKLIGTTDANGGMKTWTWRESQPSSTYLFTVVAGELVEVKDAWRNIPVTYYAPRDRADRLASNYRRTPAMIDFFSKKLGVDYPWEKYAQSMVDEFAGGMENSSATTNTASSLRNPKLQPEYPMAEDGLISHELGHQWFGDLVTTKDWGNIWLNEGFATFLEFMWTESHFGRDEGDYQRWEAIREWVSQHNLYAKPIVRRDFDDSSEFDGNAYGKGALVLGMLRYQLGDDAFYAGLKHYLELNRGKNVVTADLIKAIEEATHTNVDQFFDQWVYGAGAPKFEITYQYDTEKKQVAMHVKQTQQKIEGRVGLFCVPVEVEITNATGPKLYPLTVSKAEETFTLPSATDPQMVLFDKGARVLKSLEFKKEVKGWLYQLKNASEVPDRADAAVALGKVKGQDEAAAALGDALRHDNARGVRVVAAQSLGVLETPAAAKELLNALSSVAEPDLRSAIVQALGSFQENSEVAAKLAAVAKKDASYRAQAAALEAIGKIKPAGAYAILVAAVGGDSPDGYLRESALAGLGSLGDDQAVPLLREWTLPGKDFDSREAAIGSLGRLKKDDKEITRLIEGYLREPHLPVRIAAVFALGTRGDTSAIPALQTLLNSNDLSSEMATMVQGQIERLNDRSGQGGARAGVAGEPKEVAPKNSEDERLIHLERLVQEMNDRLKNIEGRLAQVAKP